VSLEILAAALAYLAAGFSIIPLMPGSKLPATKWKPYETLRPTIIQLEAWFEKTRNNIGLMMGTISGNAFALDFDDPRLAWFTFDLEKLAQVTFVQSTPSGGFHVLFRAEGAPIRTTSFRGRGLDLDVKAQGGYIAVDPSDLGYARYRRLSPDLRVATVEDGAYEALIERLVTRSTSIGVAPLYSAPPRAPQRPLSEWWAP